MTHAMIAHNTASFEKKSYWWSGITITVVVAVLFIVLTFLPQDWIDTYLETNKESILGLPSNQGLRYLPLATGLAPTLAVFNLVTGVINAAESRSYLGAGMTRMALWRDARRANLFFGLMLWLILIIAFLTALLLDGGVFGISITTILWWTAGPLIAILIAYELGYFCSLLYVRLHWVGATLAIGCFTVGLVGISALLDQSGILNALGWVASAAGIMIVLICSYRMLTTLPIRRSS